MIAFTSALEPLRIANRMADRELYGWQIVSRDGGPVRASNGCLVATDQCARRRRGRAGAGQPDRRPVQRSRRGADSRRPSCSPGCAAPIAPGAPSARVCTGAHLLARAGLLDGHRCTIHWENLPGFVEAFPEIAVTADLFEVDRNRFTCSGGTAALDLMLHLIARAMATSSRPRFPSSACSIASASRTTTSACRSGCGSASITPS